MSVPQRIVYIAWAANVSLAANGSATRELKQAPVKGFEVGVIVCLWGGVMDSLISSPCIGKKVVFHEKDGIQSATLVESNSHQFVRSDAEGIHQI